MQSSHALPRVNRSKYPMIVPNTCHLDLTWPITDHQDLHPLKLRPTLSKRNDHQTTWCRSILGYPPTPQKYSKKQKAKKKDEKNSPKNKKKFITLGKPTRRSKNLGKEGNFTKLSPGTTPYYLESELSPLNETEISSFQLGIFNLITKVTRKKE